jgi:hypothetical protein
MIDTRKERIGNPLQEKDTITNIHTADIMESREKLEKR